MGGRRHLTFQQSLPNKRASTKYKLLWSGDNGKDINFRNVVVYALELNEPKFAN